LKLTKSKLKEMIREELKLTEAKKPAQLIKSKGSGRFSGNYVFVKNTDVGYMYQQAGRSGKPLKSGNTQYFTFKHYKDEVEKGKNYDIVREELKLTEDFKNSEWEVYVADDPYGKNEKVVKVAKSKRAAVILYNKLIKTDKYFEVGMRVKGYNEGLGEGKLDETVPMGKHDKVKFRKFMDMALKHAGTNPDEIAKSLFRLGVPNKFVKKMGDVLANQVKGMA